MCVIILFMYIYAFYKHGGVAGWEALKEEGLTTRAMETGRSITGILVGICHELMFKPTPPLSSLISRTLINIVMPTTLMVTP